MAASKKKSAIKAAPVARDIECHFDLVKETKGALRYEQHGFDEKNMDAVEIGTLYLRKAAFPSGHYPQHITVKVIEVDTTA